MGGVQVADEVYEEYKFIKKGKKYRYIIFHIQDEKSIVIESSGGRESTYDEYLEKLTDDACKYGLYDFEFEHALEGIGKYIQATDKSEATSEVVIEKIKSTARSYSGVRCNYCNFWSATTT